MLKISKELKLQHYLIILIILFGLDQLTKISMASFNQFIDLGLMRFWVVENPGVIFGKLSNLSEAIRVIFLGVLGSYFFVLYLLLLYFLKNKSVPKIKMGISFLVAGVLGNAMDKIRLGYVIDFINIPFLIFKKYAFNVADVFLIIGVVMVMYSLIRDFDIIFRSQENRRTFLIAPKYQLSISLICILGLLLFCFTNTLFFYSFFRTYISPEIISGDHLYTNFILGTFVIFLVYSLIALLFMIIYTHRSVGAIRALKRFVGDLKHNPEATLTLREGDLHPELMEISEELKKLVK